MPNSGKNDHPSKNEDFAVVLLSTELGIGFQSPPLAWIMKAVVKLGLLFIFQLIRAGDISKLIKDCGRFFYFALKGEQKRKKNWFVTFFTIAGSEGAEIQSISMEGCDGSLDFCQAPKGSTVKGKMTFKSKSQVASLQCKIYGKIFGLFSIPFPGGCPGSQDACKVNL